MHRVVYKRGNYIVKKIRDGYYVYNKNKESDENVFLIRDGTQIHYKEVEKNE